MRRTGRQNVENPKQPQVNHTATDKIAENLQNSTSVDTNTPSRRPQPQAPPVRVNSKIKCREGLRVNIDHGGGVVTRYCHAVALNVTAGQQVLAGQVLGWVGSTANSSGPHLHFETHRGAPPATNDSAIDATAFLHTVGVEI